MTIEERVESLEKQNRRLRKLSLASIAIALAALMGGTAISVGAYSAAIEPDSVTTKAIYLKDSSNRTRLALEGRDGRVVAYDWEGRRRAELSSFGYITVYDSREKKRAELDESGGVRVYDENAKGRVGLTSNGYVNVYDENAKLRVALSPAGYVTTSDANGTARVRLSQNSVSVYDAKGDVRVNLGIRSLVPGKSDGYVEVRHAPGKGGAFLTSNGFLNMHDDNGRLRVSVRTWENKIYFRDAAGKLVRTLP